MEQVQYLLPSEIRFSQNSISNKFSDALGKQQIGIVLDKIYNGDSALRDKITDNLAIGRSKKPGYDGLWFTVNNRSLWVLKELEVLGRLKDRLPVKVDPNGIDPQRFTTQNSGKCVIVRTKPVGGNRAVPADFWRYKGQAMAGGGVESYSFLQMGGAVGLDDYDDGYDSDEYYH